MEDDLNLGLSYDTRPSEDTDYVVISKALEALIPVVHELHRLACRMSDDIKRDALRGRDNEGIPF